MGNKRITDSSKFNLVAVFVLVVIGFIIYADTLPNSFVWDDEKLILDNQDIRSWARIPGILAGGLFFDIKGNFYRPVQSLSYLFDYQFGGLNPVGYHLTNLLLHISNAIILLRILLVITGKRAVSFCASIIFLVHPVQTEAVAYISGRADLLAAFFVFLSVFFALIPREKQVERQPTGSALLWVLPLLSILSFSLALLSKESAIILPFLIVLCDRHLNHNLVKSRGNRVVCLGQPKWYYPAILLIVLFYVVFRVLLFSAQEIPLTSNPYSFYQRAITNLKVLNLYLEPLLIPINLRMDRVVSINRTFFTLPVSVATIVLSTVVIFAWKSWRNSRTVFFGLAWCFIALLPYMNWFPLNAEMAEHWLYLPLAGLSLLFSLFFEMSFPRPHHGVGSIGKNLKPGLKIRQIGIGSRLNVFIGLIILFSFVVLTMRRNLDWKNNRTIYSATAEDSPESPRAQYNLGNIYLAEGRLEQAVKRYRLSLLIKPWDTRCRGNLGQALLRLGRLTEALSELEIATQTAPVRPIIMSKLGVAYGMAGRMDEAISMLRAAVLADPASPEIHNNLGAIYTRLRKYDDALRAYEQALRLNPKMREAIFNMGIVYYHQNRFAQAAEQMEKVLNLDPQFGPALSWRKKITTQDKAKPLCP